MTSRHRRHLFALAAGVLVLAAGCGGSSRPVERVPQLAETLTRVDDAVVDHRYGRARRHLNGLVKTTIAAHEAGDLDPQQADRILAAAAQLMTALPEPAPQPEPEPAPAPDDDSDDEHSEKEEEKLEKKLEEEQKKLEEERKKAEEKAEKDEEDD